MRICPPVVVGTSMVDKASSAFQTEFRNAQPELVIEAVR
jgi:hypothetical protein